MITPELAWFLSKYVSQSYYLDEKLREALKSLPDGNYPEVQLDFYRLVTDNEVEVRFTVVNYPRGFYGERTLGVYKSHKEADEAIAEAKAFIESMRSL